MLHLHRHERTEGVVDQEARVVVEQLATQHSELFRYLHQEIESLKKDSVREQFAEEVETWAGKVQEEVERQGREITSLRENMETSISDLSAELAGCKKDMDRGLLQVRMLVQETQKQLHTALERLNSRVTDMAGEWGKDISRILTVSKENNAAVDSRLATLAIQSDNEYVRLHNLIQETKNAADCPYGHDGVNGDSTGTDPYTRRGV